MRRNDEQETSTTGAGIHAGIGTAHDVDAGTLEVAREALARVRQVLGTTASEQPLDEADPQSAPPDRSTISRQLRRGWDDVAAQMRALAGATDESERLTSLIDVLNVVHTAEEITGSGPTAAGSPMSRVRERIQSLGTAGSLDDMVDCAPEIVAGLGFDRVLLSRVVESTWLPERLYFKGNAQWAEEVLETLSKNPLSLNTSVLETQMVRQAVPLRVLDPENRPLMNRLMVKISHTSGYIAAPITEAGAVVGFLHADCYYQGRVPSQADLETLWLFAEALGPMFAHQSLAERLATLRREIDTPVSIFGRGRSRGSTTSAEASAPPVRPRVVGGPRRANPVHEIVTHREAEVLRLMSEGASNEQIARRLVISVGTVKSHVKRILRKLDVANRAEAASLWLHSEYGRTPTTSRSTHDA